MKRLVGNCDRTATVLPVVELIAEFGNMTAPYAGIEESKPIRVGPVATPFMLHIKTDNPTLRCPKLYIERVVTCPDNCGYDEIKYPFPCECGNAYLLPAGTYDITVCKQEVAPMEAGESLEVSFIVETVSEVFAMVYGNKLK